MQQHEANHLNFIINIVYILQVSSLLLTNLKYTAYLNGINIAFEPQARVVMSTTLEAHVCEISCRRVRKGFMNNVLRYTL